MKLLQAPQIVLKTNLFYLWSMLCYLQMCTVEFTFYNKPTHLLINWLSENFEKHFFVNFNSAVNSYKI